MADLTSNQVCNICCVHYNAGLRCCALGTVVEGGNLFAKSGGVAWIVAPKTYELTRTWYARNDAVTLANNAFGSGDWFIPNLSELLYGSNYKEYWDTYSTSTTSHWTDTFCDNAGSCTTSWSVVLCRSCSCTATNNLARTVRAFRRVFY